MISPVTLAVAFALFCATAGILEALLRTAWLFQLKEWRWDRLLEHLRREGWMPSLLGRIRTALLASWLSIAIGMRLLELQQGMVLPASVRLLPSVILLVLFALLAIHASVHRRIKMPVFTAKAFLILLIATLLNIVAMLLLPSIGAIVQWGTPILLAAQGVIVLCAWALVWPLDAIGKRRVMERAAKHRSAMKNATVIAVAGSVGKTTTKELLACVLQDFSPIVTPSHVNTEMGVAQWLLKQSVKENALFIVEMGAYAKGEIATLSAIAQPTIAVMTALGSDHVALFGSEVDIIEANAEVLDALPIDGVAILNGMNENSASLRERAACTTILTTAPLDINEQADGLHWTTNGVRYHLPAAGKHTVQNALLAIAVGTHLGVETSRMQSLLQNFHGLPHTFQLQHTHGIHLLDDTYNSSPLSMHAALDWSAERVERPRVLLTSGLMELGSEEESYLRTLGQKASQTVERVIFTTESGRRAFQEGFGAPVEQLDARTERIASGGVLLCVGRMQPATIERILPMPPV